MLTGHWNTIGNFLGDLMSGKGAKGRSAAKRSLGGFGKGVSCGAAELRLCSML